MCDISVRKIDSIVIPGYYRRAWLTSWFRPYSSICVPDIPVPGRRFLLVLYQNKNNHKDCLVEIQSCDFGKFSEIDSMRDVSKRLHLMDKHILNTILNQNESRFDFVEIQGRHLIRFENLYPSKRPSEQVLRNSEIGSYLLHNGVEAALILCFPNKIDSIASASIVRKHMENIYSYCSESSENGSIVSQINSNLKKINESKDKILKLEESRRRLLDAASQAEVTLANHGLKFYGDTCDYQGQRHFAF